MKKALVIFSSDENDKTAWSGTYYQMNLSIKNHFDCEYLRFTGHTKHLEKIISLYYRLIHKLFKIDRTIKPLWYFWYASRKTVKYIRKSTADYVFIVDSRLGAFLNNTNKKIIYIGDSTFKAMLNYYWFSYSKRDCRIYDKIHRRTVTNASFSFLASQWAVDSSIKDYGTDPSATICLPFGANLPECKHAVKRIDSEIINVLFCGVDKVRKGLDLAIDTIKELNKRNKQRYVLHVLGIDGSSDGGIIYHGRKNKNDDHDLQYIQCLYEKANLFLLPTKAECAGIVFCEAAMYSLPIVSHKTGGVPTYVLSGFNGTLLDLGSNEIDFANAIETIILDKNVYEMYSKNSRKYYEERLNWGKWGEEVAKLLN